MVQIQSLTNIRKLIFVVVDRLSKYSQFRSLSNPYTASSVAQMFMDHIFCLHGIHSSIVSDCNTTFTSHFRLLDTKLHMSLVYYPPIEGPTTVINKYWETYLHCFISEEQHQWEQWLPLAGWWYNNSYHIASKMTPYEAIYG